jgi:hypothetical protein
VVNHLREQFKSEADVGIACIYCNYKEKDVQIPINLIASLWSQLVQQQDSLSNNVQDLYKDHRRRGTRPALSEVSRILRSEAGRYSKIFVIVDALDECPEAGRSRAILLTELRALQPTVNLMATSRFLDNIAREFEGAIQLEISASIKDVQEYVRGRFCESLLSRKISKDAALREDIMKTVVGNAKKMYKVSSHDVNLSLKSSMC